MTDRLVLGMTAAEAGEMGCLTTVGSEIGRALAKLDTRAITLRQDVDHWKMVLWICFAFDSLAAVATLLSRFFRVSVVAACATRFPILLSELPVEGARRQNLQTRALCSQSEVEDSPI